MALESEPIAKLPQSYAYQLIVKTSEYNYQTRCNLLAFAQVAQLDHIGGNYHRTQRLVIQAQDLTAQPPIPEILEDDDAYRSLIQLAPEGFSIAEPRGIYIYLTHYQCRWSNMRALLARAKSKFLWSCGIVTFSIRLLKIIKRGAADALLAREVY